MAGGGRKIVAGVNQRIGARNMRPKSDLELELASENAEIRIPRVDRVGEAAQIFLE